MKPGPGIVSKRREAAGCTIVAVGHETGGEFVCREHGADAALAQRFVEREVLAAWHAENMIHAV